MKTEHAEEIRAVALRSNDMEQLRAIAVGSLDEILYIHRRLRFLRKVLPKGAFK